VGSDEENTPDYSHPPSSQCSTLESNPDLPQMVQQLGSVAKKRPHCDTKEVREENNLRGIFKKFPHFYIFAGNGEGGRSINWSCLRVSCD